MASKISHPNYTEVLIRDITVILLYYFEENVRVRKCGTSKAKNQPAFLRLSPFVEQATMNKIKGNKNTEKNFTCLNNVADRDHLFQDILDRIC